MTWIKLEDNAPRHPKIAGLSDRAFRAWVNGLCYSSEFLTDGFLPVTFLVSIKRTVQDELLAAGLWLDGAGRITIHDYLIHQTSKAHVENERRRNRDRRSTSGRTNGTPFGGTDGKPRPEVHTEADHVPPTPLKGARRKTKLRTVGLQPSAESVAQSIETRRRRVEMAASGMTDAEIEAVFEREFQARRAS